MISNPLKTNDRIKLINAISTIDVCTTLEAVKP
jgi:hypothetical protein